jgi:glycosyltransferase involved in cell wall biosynthesis
MPIVSILLPVRNGAGSIRASIRSILHQTFSDFELIVLDDGSTDGTPRIVESCADTRIRLIVDGMGKGLAARLNEGVKLARGRYIARMDADDICFPIRLERQIGFLDDHPEIDLVGCRAIVFRNAGEILGMLPFAETHEEICARPWRGIPLPHPTWVGRVEWFRQNPYRFPEVVRAEDQELLLRASGTSRYACLNEILFGYRQGAFNFPKTLLARRTLLKAQLEYFAGKHQWKNYCLALSITTIKVCIDAVASLPACEKFFFWRMSEPAPAVEVNALKGILAQTGSAT